MKQVGNRHLTDVWAVLVQGHGRIIAPDFCVAHREANSGLSTLNRTKSILSIYHQQRQLQKQRGMCLNDTYPFCQQPLSGNCHSICFSKPVLWTATSVRGFPGFWNRSLRCTLAGAFAVVGEREGHQTPATADFSRWPFRSQTSKPPFSTTRKSDFK